MTTYSIYMTAHMHKLRGVTSVQMHEIYVSFYFVPDRKRYQNKIAWQIHHHRLNTAHLIGQLLSHCEILVIWLGYCKVLYGRTFNLRVTALLWESSARSHERVHQLMTYLWNIVSYKQVSSQLDFNQQLESTSN